MAGVDAGATDRGPVPDPPLAPNASPQIAGGLCPVIVGPTAVGKTSLVLRLAAELPIEVISLDSRQIYRGLRIGTAQPTAAERTACPHHLVDFLPPEQRYSAQRYRADFCRLWREITARARLPVLVGGAGFYLRAVSDGFFALPAGSDDRLPDVRARVAALSAQDVAAELRRVDPVLADRLHPNDHYRRRRALEVFFLAGFPASELAAAQRISPALDLAFPLVRLERPVSDLDRRIAQRTAAMLDSGWIDETADLLQRHDAACPGLHSLGYLEIARCLRGDLARSDLAPAIVQATRQYARRQRTWFRKLTAVASGPPEDPTLWTTLNDLIRRGLGAS